jgi:hypothetical protein
MNEEEEEAPLEGSHVRRNRLARERHVARSKEQRATDARRRTIQRATHKDAQITTDATWRVDQRVAHNNAHIALENAVCANALMLLHPNRQHETRKVDRHAY